MTIIRVKEDSDYLKNKKMKPFPTIWDKRRRTK